MSRREQGGLEAVHVPDVLNTSYRNSVSNLREKLDELEHLMASRLNRRWERSEMKEMGV